MLVNNYFPVITCPTRFSKNGCTLIDNIFTNNLDDHYITNTLINDISDNLPVFYLSTKVLANKSSNTKYIKRLVDEARISTFSSLLELEEWNVDSLDVNHCLMTNFKHCIIIVFQ